MKKDQSGILKNIFSLAAAKAITSLLPLIVLPYLISTIGIDQYGIIIFALSFLAYFNTAVDYSFKISAVRSISKKQKDLQRITNIASEVLYTKGFILIVSLILGSVIIFVTPVFSDHLIIFLILLSSLVGHALQPNWFFAGIEKMEYLASFTLLFKALHAISIFVFIHNTSDTWIYALIISLEQICIAILGIFIMRFKFNIVPHKVSFSTVKQQLKQNSNLFVNQLLPNLYNNTSTLLLGLFGGTAITGVFGILRKVTNLIENVMRMISSSFFPAINRVEKFAVRFAKIQWITTLTFCIVILISSPWLLTYFKVYSTEAYWSLFILTLGLIGLTMYDIYGLNFFIVRNQDKLVLKNTLVFSTLGLICAFPTIYFGGLLGAATIVSVTRIAIGSRLLWKYKLT